MPTLVPPSITTNIDRFAEAPPPEYVKKEGPVGAEAPTMTLAEFKKAKAEEEKRAAQAELDRMHGLMVDQKEPPFSIPRVDHSSAGTLAGSEEVDMFYATSNAIFGAGNGLTFATKPFRRRGLDGTFTKWASGDQVSLQASGEPIWGRQGLDASFSRSNCLPQPTAWGSLPCEPPTCTTKRVSH